MYVCVCVCVFWFKPNSAAILNSATSLTSSFIDLIDYVHFPVAEPAAAMLMAMLVEVMAMLSTTGTVAVAATAVAAVAMLMGGLQMVRTGYYLFGKVFSGRTGGWYWCEQDRRGIWWTYDYWSGWQRA